MGRVRQLGRSILSFLPRIGILKAPDRHRPSGFSVMMTVKDEEDWIEKSVRSIVDAVDEVVVVDNGSDDETPTVLESLRLEMPGKLRTFRYPEQDYCGAVNYTLAQTRYSWILRWPGDFVGRTTGGMAVSKLVDRIRALDPKRYYCLWLGPVTLGGDLFHQPRLDRVELEPLAFVYSPALRYEQVGRFETLLVPWYYKRVEWHELYSFHMHSLKPARRLLYRHFWTEWMSLPDKSRFPTLDSYVRHRITEVFGTSDLNEATRRRMRDLVRDLVPYDRARFGDYPAIIQDELANPKYRLVYEGGRIVSRNDIEPPPGPTKPLQESH